MENPFKYITPPSLSIILPCYNVDKYIERALLSIINQTIKNIEIICINDGSNDKTLDIVNGYRDSFDQKGINFYVISEKDTGIYNAMNKGVK